LRVPESCFHVRESHPHTRESRPELVENRPELVESRLELVGNRSALVESRLEYVRCLSGAAEQGSLQDGGWLIFLRILTMLMTGLCMRRSLLPENSCQTSPY
jgi:hypothetical protein